MSADKRPEKIGWTFLLRNEYVFEESENERAIK